jgi:hypothetical protein
MRNGTTSPQYDKSFHNGLLHNELKKNVTANIITNIPMPGAPKMALDIAM